MENSATPKSQFLPWFSVFLTILGFVWQAAVLWEKMDANNVRLVRLEAFSYNASEKLTAVDTKLTMLVEASNKKETR